MAVGVEQHFFEHEGFVLVFQTGRSIPTRDNDKDFSARLAWGRLAIKGTQLMIRPGTFQFDAGRGGNETTVKEGFCL